MTSTELARTILEKISQPLTTEDMEEISFLFFENFDYNELFDNGTFEETSHFLKFIHLSSGPSTIEDFVTEIIYMNNGDKKEYKEEMVENIQKALPWIGKSW